MQPPRSTPAQPKPTGTLFAPAACVHADEAAAARVRDTMRRIAAGPLVDHRDYLTMSAAELAAPHPSGGTVACQIGMAAWNAMSPVQRGAALLAADTACPADAMRRLGYPLPIGAAS